MQIRTIKTEDLTGAALDWAVAKAAGQLDSVMMTHASHTLIHLDGHRWAPSTDWSQGAPLIERYSMMIDKNFEEFSTPEQPWFAQTDFFWCIGETVLIAICRAVVRRQLGDTVNIPEGLINEQS